MASDSPKGEAARTYFVTVEERAKAIAHGQKPTEWPADVLKGILQECWKRFNDYRKIIERLNRITW